MGFNPPLKEWFATQKWTDEIRELPQKLSEATSGQLGEESVAAMVDGYSEDKVGEETIWQLIVLRRSIENLLRR